MRISDWSSDVCSSDLSVAQPDVAKRKSLNGHAGVNQHACGIRRGSVCRYQPHFLSFAVRMHGIGEGGGLHPRALKCVWPFGGIAWKADPCPIMLGPFGWLAVGHGFQSRACQRFTPSLSQTERNRKNASRRSEEHTSELQSLMRISYAVFC